MNTKQEDRNNRRRRIARAVAGLMLISTSAMFGGCEVLFPIMGGPTISDGELKGINGWDVQASINIEPNQGREGTPVGITISFSRGGESVTSIELEDNTGSNCRLAQTWRSILNRTSDNRWQMPTGRLYLTGISGTSRFVALNSAGTRVAIGDVLVNGGCGSSSSARVITTDGEQPTAGAFFDKMP